MPQKCSALRVCLLYAFMLLISAPALADRAGAADVVSGFITELPPESPEARAARHREVARRREQPAAIISHRGAHQLAPENTLEALAASMDRGGDGCEIDIRRSADGVLYLHHDDELGRVFKGTEPVGKLKFHDLLRRPLTATYGTANASTRIPTLAAALEVARQRAMLLHLDVKEPGLDDDIARLLDAADAWDHVVHVNDYNSERLRTNPKLKTFHFKGWLHEAGEGEAAMKAFLAKPARLIMTEGDPAPALVSLGRTAPDKSVPLPDGLRVDWTADGPVAAKLAAASDKDGAGWRELFNGKDLDNWTQIGSAKWRVEDGVIVGGQEGDPRRSGLLQTKEQFKDFELELEAAIDEHGKYNSGVYLRNDPAGKGGRSGYQINLGRGQAEEYFAGLFTDRWLDKGDENDTIRKPLDWNKLRILANGGHIEVVLNGVKVVDYTDPNPPEKFLRKGVIAFQTYGAEGHAGWVKFRNIRIRPIE